MIKNLYNKHYKSSEFNRNVLSLMTGTTIAQAIPIAISPILTRIYSPEDFGVFALYMSVALILSVVATGRYELAILLPKKDEEAINIVVLSIIIAICVSLIILFIVFIFNSHITNYLGNQEISKWLYFIPLSILLSGIFQSFNIWSNRNKRYKRLAVTSFVQSGTTSASNVGMGFSGFESSGLIYSTLIGQTIATTFIGKQIIDKDKNIFKKVKKLQIFALAKRYIKFPKFLVIAHGMNAITGQLPIILLSSMFGATIAGFYMLVQRVVRLPMNLIATSFGNVYRQKASEQYIVHGNCRKVFMDTFKKLFLISFIPFLIFYFISPFIFPFIFGESWRVAGEYAQILTPMFFVQFVTSPISLMFIIANKQDYDLYWQIVFLILVLISFYISQNIKNTLWILSIVSIFMYLVAFYYSFVLTIRKEKSEEAK